MTVHLALTLMNVIFCFFLIFNDDLARSWTLCIFLFMIDPASFRTPKSPASRTHPRMLNWTFANHLIWILLLTMSVKRCCVPNCTKTRKYLLSKSYLLFNVSLISIIVVNILPLTNYHLSDGYRIELSHRF